MIENNSPPVPAWFRIVGVLALIWNLMGVSAYLMQVNMSEEDMAALPEAQRVPPWDWRHGKRDPESKPKSLPDQTFRCSTKRKCSEMVSCVEARFYLKDCGLTRLDGDGDGVPCESLCK